MFYHYFNCFPISTRHWVQIRQFFDRPIDLPNKNTEQKYRDMGFLQCEAPKIAKLVYNSNNYGLWYF